MQTANCRFDRINNVTGFLSQNTPSTDALNALQIWCYGQKDRTYVVKVDEEEFIVAQLSWKKSDMNAGMDLNVACERSGIERHYEVS